jgi:hypothetical protein
LEIVWHEGPKREMERRFSWLDFPQRLKPQKAGVVNGTTGSRALPALPIGSRALCRPREIRELTGFGRGPNITAEQGRALS